MISTLFQSFQFPPGRNSERDFFIRLFASGELEISLKMTEKTAFKPA